jgi:hypothetical protein
MPLHCRRCYTAFDNEGQITNHQRSSDGCIIKDAKPLEGFSKDQETKLRGKRSMFRAGSEEEKWKIVYLILFPETALDAMPSPCQLFRHSLSAQLTLSKTATQNPT